MAEDIAVARERVSGARSRARPSISTGGRETVFLHPNSGWQGLGPELGPLPPTPLATSLGLLASLVSPFTGICSQVEELIRRRGETRLVMFGARAGRTVSGVGTARVRNAALICAISEMVERYSMSYLDPRRVVIASYRELEGPAISPDRFALFEATQYQAQGCPFVPFTPNTRVAWILGTRVLDNTSTWVPLDAVLWPHGVDIPAAHITCPSSNGLACHVSFDEAILAGLLEVIERDAFMLMWYARLSLPVIARDWGLDREHGRRLLPTAAVLRLIDLSAFHHVPTVMAVLRAPEPDPIPLTVGAAAKVTLEIACEKAASEACQVRAGLVAERHAPLGDPDAVEEPLHHAQFYLDRTHLEKAAFLDAGQSSPPSTAYDVESHDVRGALRDLVNRVRCRGSDVFAVDVTPPDIRSAGLAVVKTICPELQPLDIVHRRRHLGSPRLRELPAQLGLRGEPLALGELNHDPHPFP